MSLKCALVRTKMKVSPFKKSNFLLSIRHHPPPVTPCLSTAPSYFQGYTPCYASSSLAAGFVVTSFTYVPAISCIQPAVCSVFFFHVFPSLPADGCRCLFYHLSIQQPVMSLLLKHPSLCPSRWFCVVLVVWCLTVWFQFTQNWLCNLFLSLLRESLWPLLLCCFSLCCWVFFCFFLFPPILSQRHLRLYIFFIFCAWGFQNRDWHELRWTVYTRMNSNCPGWKDSLCVCVRGHAGENSFWVFALRKKCIQNIPKCLHNTWIYGI